MDVKILGIVVGTATEWEKITDWDLVFYNFKPVLNGVPEGNLLVDLQSGELEIHDSGGVGSKATVLMRVPAYGFLKQNVEHAHV